MVSTEVELKEMKKTFELMDTNGDGILSKDEVFEGLKQVGFSDEGEINSVFENMDLDGNAKIEYTEFIAAMLDHSK